MKTLISQSTVRPPEWDTTSSSTTVYHNYNIVEVPGDEDTPTMFNYDQDVYTREEYNQQLAADTAARVSLAEAAILALMDMEVL